MGIETVLFKSEEKKAASDIANTLRQIADKIDDGTMILKQGSEEITLEFPKNMVLELKIEEEQGKRLKKSFEIELCNHNIETGEAFRIMGVFQVSSLLRRAHQLQYLLYDVVLVFSVHLKQLNIVSFLYSGNQTTAFLCDGGNKEFF